MQHVGYDDRLDENAMEKHTRIRLIDFVCRMMSSECLSRMHTELKSHVDDNKILPVNLESSVFCYGLMASALSNEGPRLIEALWKEMQASDNTEYRLRIIGSLGCYADVEFLFQLLKTTLAANDEARYLAFESFEVVQSVYSKSIEGVEATMDFVIEFHSTVVEQLQTANLIDVLLENLSKRIANERLLEKVNKPENLIAP